MVILKKILGVYPLNKPKIILPTAFRRRCFLQSKLKSAHSTYGYTFLGEGASQMVAVRCHVVAITLVIKYEVNYHENFVSVSEKSAQVNGSFKPPTLSPHSRHVLATESETPPIAR